MTVPSLSALWPQLYPWIDLLWLPVGALAVGRGKRLMTLAFIATCIISLRTQIELFQAIGYPNGILGWLKLGLYERGLAIYGVLIALFLILAHLSPRTSGVIVLAVTITLYIFGLCASIVAMMI